MFCLWGGRGAGREKIILGRATSLYKGQNKKKRLGWKHKSGEEKFPEGRILGLGKSLDFFLNAALWKKDMIKFIFNPTHKDPEWTDLRKPT